MNSMEDMVWALRSIADELRSIADELRFLANELNEKEKDEIEHVISKYFKEVATRMPDSTLNSKGD